MRAILLISGPPGAGKTTIAESLVLMQERGVLLHQDDLWGCIRSGYVEPWREESAEQNRVVMEALAGTAATFARGGYAVVVDGVIGPWFLQPFVDAAEPGRLGVDYLVLRPSEDECVRRAAARGPGTLTDGDVIRGLYSSFSDLGSFERHAFDSGSRTTHETASAVTASLAQGLYRLETPLPPRT